MARLEYSLMSGSLLLSASLMDCSQGNRDLGPAQSVTNGASAGATSMAGASTDHNSGGAGASGAGRCNQGALRCAAVDVEQCGSDGTWQTKQTCPFVCQLGTCVGVCSPDDRQCSMKVPQVCNNHGAWDSASAECPYVCSQGSCSGVCVPGSTQCSSSTQASHCGDDGKWAAPEACTAGCIDNACMGECIPNTDKCSSGSALQHCNAMGAFETPVPCKNACIDGVCKENPKTVFITSALYDGNMGGLAGADAKCQALAVAAHLSGTFYAWLADGTDGPSTRFPKDVGPYRLVNNAIVDNNWPGLIDGSLLHAINLTELGGPPPLPPATYTVCRLDSEPIVAVVRSNVTSSGIGYASSSCGVWTDSTASSSAWGNPNVQDNLWALYCSGGDAGCAVPSPIYCFQQ